MIITGLFRVCTISIYFHHSIPSASLLLQVRCCHLPVSNPPTASHLTLNKNQSFPDDLHGPTSHGQLVMITSSPTRCPLALSSSAKPASSPLAEVQRALAAGYLLLSLPDVYLPSRLLLGPFCLGFYSDVIFSVSYCKTPVL